MGRTTLSRWTCLVAAALMAACGAEDTVADGPALAAALGAAHPGDVIRLEATDYVGTFVVPDGVSVVGAGRGRTIIRVEEGSSSDATAVVGVIAASGTTRIADLTIGTLDGRAALSAFGAGELIVENVDLLVGTGIGLGVQGLSVLSATDVMIRGNVQPDRETSAAIDPTPMNSSSHGVVAMSVGRAFLSGVDVSGMAVAGGMMVDSSTSWSASDIAGVLGTGLQVHGGTAELTDLVVRETLGGVSLVPAYQVVFAGGSDVTSTRLSLRDGQGYGLLAAGATARCSDTSASGNDNAAVWIQGSTGFELTGGEIADNTFAGVVIVDSSATTVRDLTVRGTREATRLSGEVGMVQVGDGVQLVGSSGVDVANLTLIGNERTGILWDLGAAPGTDVTFSAVTADGAGSSYGVVAQGGTPPAGWDGDVDRRGATAGNDAAFVAGGVSLDVVGAVAPTDISTRSGAESIGADGLEALGIVMPNN